MEERPFVHTGSKRILTVEVVRKLVKAKNTDRQMAWALGVSKKAVEQFRRRHGIKSLIGRNAPDDLIPAERDHLMCRLRKEGKTFREIGLQFGITASGVKSRFYQLGKPDRVYRNPPSELIRERNPLWANCEAMFSAAMRRSRGCFDDAIERPAERVRFRSLPPMTHVETECAMAAL